MRHRRCARGGSPFPTQKPPEKGTSARLRPPSEIDLPKDLSRAFAGYHMRGRAAQLA